METGASKRYRKSGLRAAGVYFVVYFTCFAVSVRFHPTGVVLWTLAVLAVTPILAVVGFTGRYIAQETDGYKRDVATRSMLWGTAGLLAVELLDGFMRIFGWTGHMPPFTGFGAFFVLMMGAKLSSRVADRVALEE